MTIFGLSGTNGSGKDTVAKMLEEKHGFLAISASDMLAKELKKRGLPIDRQHKSKLSAEWRREFGMGVIVVKGIEYANSLTQKPSGVIIGSLRHPGETDMIHQLGGKQIWVDADPRIRYERIKKNMQEREGTHADEGSFEDFIANEEREMHPEGDAATLDNAGVKNKADIFIENNSNDIEAFQKEAEKALQLPR